MTAAAPMSARADSFRYDGLDIDPAKGLLRCRYEVGGHQFEERITVAGPAWDAPGAEAAATLVYLFAGVSYFKAFAPPVIDLGVQRVSPATRTFLRDFYVHGLAEFAYRNDLDLGALEIVGGTPDPGGPRPSGRAPVQRPLVPFGGGMDSLAAVELLTRTTPDASLFVVSRAGDRFEAIETPAATIGLPVVRASRELDPKILRSQELGFLNGHVPVTGVLSAIAVLAAVLGGHDAVVMSNEWSASSGNVERDGLVVNHQWSKSIDFERAFRALVPAGVEYFSLLRPFSELWIARELARHPDHVRSFRSCNRAFHIDPALRLDHWCGRCDKCAFIDLILSPYLTHDDLVGVFGGAEPLDQPDLVDVFRSLVGTSETIKPFECVGDVGECRAAVQLAAARPDRAGSPVLDALLAELPPVAGAEVERLLAPLGEHFVPEPYASDLRLA